ncbi:hypothetical protein EAF00_003349 [Botryotinia globosa]|nr:hypothetical protein EAF00_003349 [Botryotinia globosa]
MRVVVQALLFSNNGTDKLRRSSERIPIHLPNPSTNTARSIHPSSISTAASSKPPSEQRHHLRSKPFRDANYQNQRSMIPKTTVQDLSNGSERTGGATPKRSEDPEGAVLPGRPVTADSRPRQGTPKGPIRRPHATPVEKPAEKSGEPPEGSSLDDSLDSHPSTEKISSRNPKEPVRDLYRPIRDLVEKSELAEPSCGSPEGDPANNSLSPQETSSELSTIRRPNNRISPKPRTSISSRQPTTSRGTYQSPPKESQQGPRTRSPTSGIRDQSSDMEVTRKNLPPNITSPRAVPSLGIAAAVQRRMTGRNETRRKDGYSGRTMPQRRHDSAHRLAEQHEQTSLLP